MTVEDINPLLERAERLKEQIDEKYASKKKVGIMNLKQLVDETNENRLLLKQLNRQADAEENLSEEVEQLLIDAGNLLLHAAKFLKLLFNRETNGDILARN